MQVIDNKLILDGVVYNITPVRDNERELWLLGLDEREWVFTDIGYWLSRDGIVRNERGKIMKEHSYGQKTRAVHLRSPDGVQRYYDVNELIKEYFK